MKEANDLGICNEPLTMGSLKLSWGRGAPREYSENLFPGKTNFRFLSMASELPDCHSGLTVT